MDLFQRIMALNSDGPFKAEQVTADTALKGGKHPVLSAPQPNLVLGTDLAAPLREGQKELVVGLGCFWGAERLFWDIPGVEATAVGYAGGYTQNPTYREVCTGRTGHAEAVRIVYDPATADIEDLLKVAFENHNPTQGDRHGNDVGSQYRSAVYVQDEDDLERVERALQVWQKAFNDRGYGDITTEVKLLSDTPSGEFYLAEDEHQQYLHKNPNGYCNHGPNGVECPTGVL